MEPESSLPYSQEPPLSLSWARPLQSTPPPDPIYWSLILILPSHLRLSLPSALFSWHLPLETLWAPLLSSIRDTCSTQSSWFAHWHNIWWGVQFMMLPHRAKYPPQHSILKHSQPTFLPQCERPSFTPIQNNKQNYNSLHFSFYIFGIRHCEWWVLTCNENPQPLHCLMTCGALIHTVRVLRESETSTTRSAVKRRTRNEENRKKIRMENTVLIHPYAENSTLF